MCAVLDADHLYLQRRAVDEVRSLREQCYDMPFDDFIRNILVTVDHSHLPEPCVCMFILCFRYVCSPTSQQVADRLLAVARAEGLARQPAMEKLAESTHADIRQALHMRLWYTLTCASFHDVKVRVWVARLLLLLCTHCAAVVAVYSLRCCCCCVLNALMLCSLSFVSRVCA